MLIIINQNYQILTLKCQNLVSVVTVADCYVFEAQFVSAKITTFASKCPIKTHVAPISLSKLTHNIEGKKGNNWTNLLPVKLGTN